MNLYYLSTTFALIAASLVCIAYNFSALSFIPAARASGGATYYVSKNGNNADGLSWGTAWNELRQINWNAIQPGDTLLLDGGVSGMTYHTTLTIGKSGLAGSPITIERATGSGHNGPVTLFGGNIVPLPYCGQTNWTAPTGTVGDAIEMNGQSWITINGESWDGIQIHGYTYKTVNFSGGESNDSMSNIEIYDNGNALQSGGMWYSEFPGIVLGFGTVTNLAFNYMDIHDNGDDAFTGGGGVDGMTVQNSWLYSLRTVPGVPSESFALCVHFDGLQIFGSTPGSNITFQNDILGPGLSNGLIFQPRMTNTVLKNSLVLDPGSNVTVENDGTSANWTIDHVTALGQSDNLTLEGSGNTVTNSIFYAGNLLLNNSISNSSNNCQWQTVGSVPGAQTVDPKFATDLSRYAQQTTDITRFPAISFLETADFSVQPGSPCQGLGSSIPSVRRFLQIVGGELPFVKPPASSPTTAPLPTQNPVQVVTARPVQKTQKLADLGPSLHKNADNLWVILGIICFIGIILSSIALYKKTRNKGEKWTLSKR